MDRARRRRDEALGALEQAEQAQRAEERARELAAAREAASVDRMRERLEQLAPAIVALEADLEAKRAELSAVLEGQRAAARRARELGAADVFEAADGHQAVRSALARAAILGEAEPRPRVGAASHQTEKPVGLMADLVTLAAPVDGLALDFFAGSGSTGEAALVHGRRVILADEMAENVQIARARLGKVARGIERGAREEQIGLFEASRPRAFPRTGTD